MEGRIPPPPQLQSGLVPAESLRSISHTILISSSPEVYSGRPPPSLNLLTLFPRESPFLTLSKQMCPRTGVSVDSQSGKYRCVNKIWHFGERKQKARCCGVRRAGARAFLIRFHLALGSKLPSLEELRLAGRDMQSRLSAGFSFFC